MTIFSGVILNSPIEISEESKCIGRFIIQNQARSCNHFYVNIIIQLKAFGNKNII